MRIPSSPASPGGGPGAYATPHVPHRPAPIWREALRFGQLCHAMAVQNIARQSTGSFGLLGAFAMPLAMTAGFLAAYELVGLFRPAIRGDVVVFLLTGILLFQLASRARSAADLTGGGAFLWHQPVQPALVVWSGALAALAAPQAFSPPAGRTQRRRPQPGREPGPQPGRQRRRARARGAHTRGRGQGPGLCALTSSPPPSSAPPLAPHLRV